jgi:hypothetical protein
MKPGGLFLFSSCPLALVLGFKQDAAEETPVSDMSIAYVPIDLNHQAVVVFSF